MFIALAIAAASAGGATDVIVPENGFTSINPPLDPSRGGILTTRSTHPWTFYSLRHLLSLLGLSGIAVTNPHDDVTKGELLCRTSPELSDALWRPAVGGSLSCAKLDSQRFKGGSPNINCGLCVACVVRRAAFISAGLSDPTEYAIERLAGQPRDDLIRARRADIGSLRHAVRAGFDEDGILASAMWPPQTDFDEIIAICQRGRQELQRVRLP
jgi:hypothetical protein